MLGAKPQTSCYHKMKKWVSNNKVNLICIGLLIATCVVIGIIVATLGVTSPATPCNSNISNSDNSAVLTTRCRACIGDCSYQRSNYQYCYLQDGSWDYCSSVLRGSYGEACVDRCTQQGEQYHWCTDSTGSWDYCSPYSSVSFDETVESAKGNTDIQVLKKYLLDGNHPDSERVEEPADDQVIRKFKLDNYTDAGGEYNYTDYDEELYYNLTLLMLAAKDANTEAIKLLLENEANVNIQDVVGRTALWYAVTSFDREYAESVQLLLTDLEIDVNIQDYDGRTALIYAALSSPNRLKLLLTEPDININIQDNRGQTALMIAGKSGIAESVKLLLAEPDINITIQDKQGETGLMEAAWCASCVQLFLAEPDIDINIQANDGRTALMQAVECASCVQLFLAEPDIDINIQDNDGRTALIQAAWSGYADSVKSLISKPDIDINIQDNNGDTALWYSASSGKTESIKLLLSKPEIDINIQSNDGDTALGWAKNDEVKSLLEEAGAQCRCVSDSCRSWTNSSLVCQ